MLRLANGVGVAERLFYEQLVNMSMSNMTKVICLWFRISGATQGGILFQSAKNDFITQELATLHHTRNFGGCGLL